MDEKNAIGSAEGKPYISYNRYFLIPFVIWVVLGGIVIMLFDREQLFRFINTHHTPFLDMVMTYITAIGEGPFILITFLVLMGRMAFRNWWFVITAIFSNAIPNALTQAVKSSINAPRPLNYFKEAEWIHTMPDWPRFMERSFPSGHTTAAFCLFCFLSLLLPPRYKGFGLLFFLLALAVGYSRVYLAAHFFHDAYVGSIIATIFVLTVVALMDRHKGRFFKNDFDTR